MNDISFNFGLFGLAATFNFLLLIMGFVCSRITAKIYYLGACGDLTFPKVINNK